jgi:iron complex transport system permease protein
VATVCGSLIMFLQHLAPHGLRDDLTVWMMGHLPQSVSRSALYGAPAIALVGTALAAATGPALDAASLSDDEARSVGVALRPLRLGLFLLAGALAAASVAVAGPIGFVGLVAPHAARLVLGPAHRPLVIGAALAGVLLVVGADALRQTIVLGAGRVPVGVFTALLGGPAFIWLLRRGRVAS